MPDDPARSPVDALAEAQRLLDADRPFHAHEVLESVWKAAPAEERELWRGLAQVAVGLTHVRRGNARGARSLLTRAADRLEPFASARPYGLDLNTLVREVRALTDTEDLPTDTDLRVRLRHPS
jgi:predicted metal-dependent hydrolase